MTLLITNTDQIDQYTATAAQTVFPYAFEIRTSSEILVYKTPVGDTPDENTDLLTLTTDYTVSNAGVTGGGNITLVVAATLGDIVTAVSNPDFSQTKDYTVTGGFTGESIQDTFNKWTKLVQKVESSIKESGLTYSVLDTLSAGQLRIPELGSDQFWSSNTAGNLVASDVNASASCDTLRTDLASETETAPGTDNVGTYNTRTSTAETMTDFVDTYTLPINDSFSLVRDPTITTKQMRMDVGAVAAATTRVLTMPNQDIDLTPASTALIVTGTDDDNMVTSKGMRDGTRQILQYKSVYYHGVATGTTAIPVDDSIPQKTEGDEYMTLAITPTISTSSLLIEVGFVGASSQNNTGMTVALFRDATVGAQAAVVDSVLNTVGSNHTKVITLRHLADSDPGTTTTFKVRAGIAAGATTTFNGVSGGRIFGGVMSSYITITELATVD